MFGKIKKFIGEIKLEMSKVTWSSRQELVNSTIVVLTAMAFLATFVGIVDFFFSHAVKIIIR